MNICNLVAGILSLTWGQSKPPVHNLTENLSVSATDSRSKLIKASAALPSQSETLLSQIATSLSSTHKIINKFLKHLFEDLKEDVRAETQPVAKFIGNEIDHVKTELKPFLELLEKLKKVKFFDSEQIKKVVVTGAILGASLGSIFEGVTEETLGEVSLYPYVQSIGIDKDTVLILREDKKEELIQAVNEGNYSKAVSLFRESLPLRVLEYFNEKPGEYGGFIMGALAGITFAHRFRKEQTYTPPAAEVIDAEVVPPNPKANGIKFKSPILKDINKGLEIMINALPESTEFQTELTEFKSNLVSYDRPEKVTYAKEEVSSLIRSHLGKEFMREENLDAVFGKYFSLMRNLCRYISYRLQHEKFNQSSIKMDKLREILDIAVCISTSCNDENARFETLHEGCYGMFEQWQSVEGKCSFVDFALSFKDLALPEFYTDEFSEYKGRSRSEVAKEVLAEFLMTANNPEILKAQLKRIFGMTETLKNVLKDFDGFVAHLREAYRPDFVKS